MYLETHETVEPYFSVKSKGHVSNHTRISCGEFHKHTLNAKRCAISLTIPPNNTPDFNSTAGTLGTYLVSNQWTLRFEFITGSNPETMSHSDVLQGFHHGQVVSKIDVEPFDCTIPLKIYGSLKITSEQKKSLTFSVK